MLAPALLLAALAGGATPTSAPSGGRTASWDSYRLILSRNIFARDRQAASFPSRFPREFAPRTGDQNLVLRGTVLQGPDRLAFFEDVRTEDCTEAAVGQAIGGGTLTWVGLDSVEYRAAAGPVRQIQIGEDLSGQPAASVASSQPSSGPADAVAATTSRPSFGPGFFTATSRPGFGPADRNPSDFSGRGRRGRSN
jgi:hypothetical protein